MLQRILLTMAALCLLCALVPACAESEVKFRNASVHDPSVMRTEDGTFYIYGSHMQAAVSTDLMQWKMISRNAENSCSLVENVQEEMREALAYAKTVTFWAPDVIRLADGRYYMYYCTCEGSSPLSALGLAVSDSPDGPFKNLGIMLKSGGPDYDATQLPNAIDPNVFYDKNGKLWMVYGSYSGGIYILKMDAASRWKGRATAKSCWAKITPASKLLTSPITRRRITTICSSPSAGSTRQTATTSASAAAKILTVPMSTRSDRA